MEGTGVQWGWDKLRSFFLLLLKFCDKAVIIAQVTLKSFQRECVLGRQIVCPGKLFLVARNDFSLEVVENHQGKRRPEYKMAFVVFYDFLNKWFLNFRSKAKFTRNVGTSS